MTGVSVRKLVVMGNKNAVDYVILMELMTF